MAPKRSLLLLAVSACAVNSQPLVVPNKVDADSELDFLVMADWGGKTEVDPNPAEANTAKLMGEMADKYTINNVFGIGDNFYPQGVDDVKSHRFNITFEEEFDADSLKDMHFYFVGGNHDYYGNVTAEIDYTAYSKRWKFPTQYYTKKMQDSANTFEIEYVMIDTPLLCGYDDDDVDEPVLDEQGRMLMGGKPWTAEDERVAESQWNWIEDKLSSSTSDYLIVMGHYPVWSIAEHGPTSCLTSKLLPMLQKYEVTAYINGHDHTFEYIESEDDKSAGTIHQAFITSGGNHVCDSSTAHEKDVPKEYKLLYHDCNLGGLTWIHVDKDSLEFRMMVGTTTHVDYTSPKFTPRKVSHVRGH